MKSSLYRLLALPLLLAVGCLQSTTLLVVNPDGSGSIVVREYFSPQITGMMSGMEDMAAQMAEGMAEAFGGLPGSDTPPAEEPKDPASLLEDAIKQNAVAKAKAFGEGVTHVSTKTKKNAAGWQGHESSYRFEDVQTLRLSPGSPDLPDEGMSASSDEAASYTFRFTPGDVATLEIVPIPAATLSEEEMDDMSGMEDMDMSAEDMGDMDGMGDMMGDMGEMGGAMMGQMMGTMFKGMRLTFAVTVKGDVVETNATFPSKKNPALITVMDLPMDRVLGNTEAMAIFSSGDPDALAKLQKLDVDGLKIEDEEKTIRIRFR
jgi:hypothetical protein